jgi:uncharacterized RDD family membrane protein YckC
MEYEDIRTIATPEGVELALPLAGIGSRFMALALDVVLQYVLLAAVVGLAVFVLGGVAGDIAFLAGGLLILLGYDVLFEVLGGGRTLGKRAAGLRVVLDSGAPIGLRASLIRNVLRLVEGNALMYVPAMVSVLLTRDNQRLGDLAAGTLVVRDPRRLPEVPAGAPVDAWTQAHWDVSAVTQDDLLAIRTFLARREQLTPQARAARAQELARALRPRVAGLRQHPDDEPFLEQLAAVKAASRSAVRPSH